MTLRISEVGTAQASRWNSLVEASDGGTIFHRLDFLAYHGDRFKGREVHAGIYQGQELFGVMPIAFVAEQQVTEARSPYGASYGGPVFPRALTYGESVEFVQALRAFVRDRGVETVRFTLPIGPCYAAPSDTLRFALLEAGAVCTVRDISSVVFLEAGRTIESLVTSRCRNMARKAGQSGVTVRRKASIAEFWPVLEKTFEKHGTAPTHSRAEFERLAATFPDRIYVDVAYLGGQPVAGIGYFAINRRVNSSFYFAQDPEAQEVQALSLLILGALEQAAQGGFSCFDFGTSSVNMEGRANIFRFKESFGAVGVFRETYLWTVA